MGDFNVVRDESKRMGSQLHSQLTSIFNHFIDHAILIDIPTGGPRFTWSDNLGSKFSKLDKFLVTNGFLDSFSLLIGLVLENNIPDHRRSLFWRIERQWFVYVSFIPLLVLSQRV